MQKLCTIINSKKIADSHVYPTGMLAWCLLYTEQNKRSTIKRFVEKNVLIFKMLYFEHNK